MIAAEHPLAFAPLDRARPDLLDMLHRLQQNTPAFAHQEFGQPQRWYGVLRGDRLLAACGWDTYVDGTVEVRYLLCDPSKEGRKLLGALAGLLAKAWEGYRVVFHCQATNTRMRRIVESLGARPIAVLYEWRSQGGLSDEQGRRESGAL